MFEVPETRYAREGDICLAYQTFGDGPLDLLFVPGGQYPVDLVWEDAAARRFLLRLASFGRVVLFDARGWGASRSGTTTTPTVEGWADDLRLVMDAVGLDRAAIVGFYAGAFFSMFFAAAHPERVSRLVLLQGFARFLRDDDYPAGMPQELLETATDLHLQGYGTGSGVALYAPTRALDPDFVHWWARCERLASSPVVAGTYWHDLVSRDLRSVLPALRVPTLVLHRRDDRFVRVDHGRYLAERIPDSTYVELDGEDSMFFVGDTDAVLDEIGLFLTGERTGGDSDRLLASVMFTDIVSSTDKAATLGDSAWRKLLDQHDEIVRAQVEHFRGRIVKATGDGVLATFDGPARAIKCACALRDAVNAIGLKLRTGIHTGEIERRGEDIAGIAVHIAARVQSLARPDDVLVSRTVTDLVAGSGIEFEDRAEHELKGVTGRWQIFAVPR